jgi:hypothetical protein
MRRFIREAGERHCLSTTLQETGIELLLLLAKRLAPVRGGPNAAKRLAPVPAEDVFRGPDLKAPLAVIERDRFN